MVVALMIFKGLGINIDGYESKRAHELWKIMKREYGANNIIALRIYTDGGYSYIIGFKNGNMKSTERDKIISRVPDIYYKIILIPNKSGITLHVITLQKYIICIQKHWKIIKLLLQSNSIFLQVRHGMLR